jgi:hypothetical protein
MQHETCQFDEPSTSRIGADLEACCATCRGLAKELETAGVADALFATLVDGERWEAAIRLAGHWLPKRKSVWWATLVWWEQVRNEPPPEQLPRIEAVVEWVLDPCDNNRRRVGAEAQRLPKTTVGGILTTAVFWSEASVAPPDCPPVGPPAHITGHLTSSAIILATAGDVQRQRQSLRFAAEVYQQPEPWSRISPGSAA